MLTVALLLYLLLLGSSRAMKDGRNSVRMKQSFLRNEFLTTVIIGTMILWGTMLCSLVKVTDISLETAA
jgi:hypothetical protein